MDSRSVSSTIRAFQSSRVRSPVAGTLVLKSSIAISGSAKNAARPSRKTARKMRKPSVGEPVTGATSPPA